ncbi:hypothetical protein C0V72_03045 [Porphyrobacter sp. TH134]|nr:hypothetical protein C0V72_03045 [Porphyrobacter sp. TH134]
MIKAVGMTRKGGGIMKLTYLIAATAMVLLPTSAHAEETRALDHFTRADLEQALRAAGATIAPTQAQGQRIVFTFSEKVTAEAMLMSCEDEQREVKCLGSALLASFAADENRTTEQSINAINLYNYNENFGRAAMGPDGVISVQMYIIADGGITPANYSRQMELWFTSATNFYNYLYEQPASGQP